MMPLVYRCPNTGFQVQAWSPEEHPETEHIYETVTCIACQRVHLVNRETGKVAGEYDE